MRVRNCVVGPKCGAASTRLSLDTAPFPLRLYLGLELSQPGMHTAITEQQNPGDTPPCSQGLLEVLTQVSDTQESPVPLCTITPRSLPGMG